MTTDRNSDEADALDVILAASKPTPPAFIPAAEVQAMEARYRKIACESKEKSVTALANMFADELAKLVPRNPE